MKKQLKVNSTKFVPISLSGLPPGAANNNMQNNGTNRIHPKPPSSDVITPLSTINNQQELIKAMEELEGYMKKGLDSLRAQSNAMPDGPDGDISSNNIVLNDEEVADLQLQTARKLRQLLSTNREFVHMIQERNWIPLLLGWLKLHDRPAVQREALWALGSIAGVNDGSSIGDNLQKSKNKRSSSKSHSLLVRHDAIPLLVNLLSSLNGEVHEQAMWILGSVAGEGNTARDSILSAGILPSLVSCLEKYPKCVSLQRIGSWTISNLVDGQPRPTINVDKVLPTMRRLLNSADAEVLSHTCWALSHMCDGPTSHIAAVVGGNGGKSLVPRLIDLLMHASWRVTKPALRTIGNIVCAEDEKDYTESIIDYGAVPYLRQLVCHQNKEIQKEACWTLSNIAAGTTTQIQAVIDSGAIPLIMKLANASETEQEVKSEASWVILNASSCGNDSQIEFLIKEGCVRVLVNLLEESSMVVMALEGIERVLQTEETQEISAVEKGEERTAEYLIPPKFFEALQKHKSPGIAKKAKKIWTQYFVSCALCLEAFSKHRAHEAGFCKECKCHVCTKCNCEVYHLTYQECLWAEDEQKNQANKKSKKSKRQKKKERKKKAKKAAAEADCEEKSGTAFSMNEASRSLTEEDGESVTKSSSISDEASVNQPTQFNAKSPASKRKSNRRVLTDESENDLDMPTIGGGTTSQGNQNRSTSPVDFVLYLQQTGSILALAKLMDALDAGEDIDDQGYGSDMDETDIELMRLSSQAQNMKSLAH